MPGEALPARTPAQADRDLSRPALKAIVGLGLDAVEVRGVLGITVSELRRSPVPSGTPMGQRAVLLLRVYRALRRLADDRNDYVRRWMRTNSRHLGGQPVEVMQSPAGLLSTARHLEELAQMHQRRAVSPPVDIRGYVIRADCPQSMIVFLDFDGVLHPDGSETQFRDAHLEALEQALAPHDALIVVISTWRVGLPLHSLARLLGPVGHRVICTAGDGPADAEAARSALIDRWLHTSGYTGPWVAIDDHPQWYDQHADRVLGVSSKLGFCPQDVDRFHALVRRVVDGAGEE